MEEYAKLLNTILTRVVFNHMTMFLLFLFIGFSFMPEHWVLHLNAKTPAIFPDWFTLSTLGSLVFTFVSTALWILLVSITKHTSNKIQEKIKTSSTKKRLLKAVYSLSPLESEILANACLGKVITRNNLKSQVAIEKLLCLELISFSVIHQTYEINPLIKPFVIDKLDKIVNAHH
ncbi:hypothetical protein JFL47_09465 [Haemophilus haemoglobinophilus]|nr:hypothetical protein [Canicola haemoglobinophilus]